MTLRLVSSIAFAIGIAFSQPTWSASPKTEAALPGDSIYQLDLPLVDQDGRERRLGDRRGKPQLVSMFYTSCQYVCPLIVDTLLKTERALPETEREQLDVLLVSFDPDNDTPLALKAVVDKRHLPTPRWRLARTDASNVRTLAAALGIQYRQLQNHDFNHTSALILLDADGRIAARSDKLGATDAAMVEAISRQFAH